MAGGGGRFRWKDFVIRWLFSFGLLTATYNPTGFSYIGWLLEPSPIDLAVKVFVGVCLLILHLFIISMALRTLSLQGVFLSVLFFSLLSWAAYSLGARLPTLSLLILWVQAAVATTLAGGMSLALLRLHLSGQVTPSEEGGHV